MIQATVNLDDELIRKEISKQVAIAVKELYPWPPLLNKQQAQKYSGFGENRMNAAFFLYRPVLDDLNGGCTIYPGKGQSYLIDRAKFDLFLIKYKKDIRNIDLDFYDKDKVAYRARIWG